MNNENNIKLDRINRAIRHLKGIGIISIQQDIVNKMEVNKTSVSLALKGDSEYLTNKFLKKFNRTFGDIFNESWLLGETDIMLSGQFEKEIEPENERGSITIPMRAFNVIEKQANSLERRDNQIDELISMLKDDRNEAKKTIVPTPPDVDTEKITLLRES
ncbi:hypothetical protein EZS27_029555 [termite gut metagenome]|jgi:hypothetical protein|uniref:Uncharacterized protein n=1 Tax=termite gut metagenome TaxID=433724 RepID=A0A5J4QGU5_9ZZZZ